MAAAQTSLTASNTQASMSHPSLLEANAETSAASGRAYSNHQVAQVSEPSETVRADGAPSSPKRAQTLPEVHPAAELIVIDHEVTPPGE